MNLMKLVNNPVFPFYLFDHFSGQKNILHFVSSAEKNIGFTDESSAEIICKNRRDLAQAVGFDPGSLVSAHQVHSANVAIVTEAEAGRGALDKISRLPDTDALVTDRKNICLMVLSADCVPVLLFDPHKKVIAAVHAGWRGTAARIVAKAVMVMKNHFGCLPEQILAGIGPSIGPCCFEVNDEVAQIFRDLCSLQPEIITPGRCAGKFQVNLWEANRLQLIETGVKNANIEIAGMCSFCHPDHFFSYRRDGVKAGRFGAGISLK